ncbi:MAG: YicC family protein [Verrucomicrobia bacterium]|nr:YicC family protein [Verrucomicrobiota bacterium]
MKSMTGHGWAEHASDGHKVSVEISSVNRKQSEVTVILPRELEVLEAQTRDEVNRRVARGRVSVRVTRHTSDGGESQRVSLDAPLARQYSKEFKKLARELHISEELTLDTLLRAPGVLQASQDVEDAEAFWPAVSAALTQALDTLVGMRELEGKHLAKDLAARIRTMRQAVARVKKLAPVVQVRYRQTLLERIRAAGLDEPQIDGDRIAKEVVYFADRSDISEELTRLEGHFAQFDTVAKSSEPVGRTLDFLAQEMNREINTLGAKANDSQISADVVMLKTELEKFREQVQNVE